MFAKNGVVARKKHLCEKFLKCLQRWVLLVETFMFAKVGVVAIVILLWCFAMSLFMQRWGE